MKKIITTTFFTAVLVVALSFPAHVAAQVPFGGFATFSMFCPCSGQFIVVVAGPTGGLFSYFPGTPQYPFAQLPRPGVWALGRFTPGSVPCLFPGPFACASPVPVATPIGTINYAGTSL